MKRPLFIVALILLGTMAHPELAKGNWVDWLQEWSGPGPFKAKWFSTYLTGCAQGPRTFYPSPVAMQDKFHQEAKREAKVLEDLVDTSPSANYHPILRQILENPTFAFLASTAKVVRESKTGPSLTSKQKETLAAFELDPATLLAIYTNPHAPGSGHDHPPLLCGYFDTALYKAESQKAEDQNGFNEVHAHFFDFGPSGRFFDSLDLGVGAGFVTIQSRDSNGNNFETNRPTFVPVRVVLRPVLLFVPDNRRQQWMGVIDIFFKETYIWGEFKGADFGASNSSFHVNGELVRSFGLNLDVSALIPYHRKHGGD